MYVFLIPKQIKKKIWVYGPFHSYLVLLQKPVEAFQCVTKSRAVIGNAWLLKHFSTLTCSAELTKSVSPRLYFWIMILWFQSLLINSLPESIYNFLHQSLLCFCQDCKDKRQDVTEQRNMDCDINMYLLCTRNVLHKTMRNTQPDGLFLQSQSDMYYCSMCSKFILR